MTPRVYCIAAAFGELGKDGWLLSGPWVAPRPEIASAQAVATYMQQHPEVAHLPLTAITVSEVPVEAIRAWLDGIDKATVADKLAQAEKVLPWPIVRQMEVEQHLAKGETPQSEKEVVPHSEEPSLRDQQLADKPAAPSVAGGADPPEPAA